MSSAPYQVVSREWPLERYSRLVGDGNDECKPYEPADNFFLRILKSNYLVISHGNEVLENFALVNAGVAMKGVYIGDSLLVILRLLNGTRRFRVRFRAMGNLSATEVCDACTRELQLYMYVTTMESARRNIIGSAETATAPAESCQSQTVVSTNRKMAASEMAKILVGIDKSKLPKAYYNAIVAQEEQEAILRLCLLDSSFPSYVESVELMIKKLVEEPKVTA